MAYAFTNGWNDETDGQIDIALICCTVKTSFRPNKTVVNHHHIIV